MKCTLTFNIETIMIHIENGIFNANENQIKKISVILNFHSTALTVTFWSNGILINLLIKYLSASWASSSVSVEVLKSRGKTSEIMIPCFLWTSPEWLGTQQRVTHFIWKVLKCFSEEVVVNLEFKGWVRSLLGWRYPLGAGRAGLFEDPEAWAEETV